MRRRDRHTVLVLAGCVGLNIATALCCITSTYVYRRRFRAVSEDLATSIKVSERASIDACAIAQQLVDMMRDGGYAVDGEAVAPPRVLGYGRTRSGKAVYIYRDLQYPDGEVRREFVKRLPFKAK